MNSFEKYSSGLAKCPVRDRMLVEKMLNQSIKK